MVKPFNAWCDGGQFSSNLTWCTYFKEFSAFSAYRTYGAVFAPLLSVLTKQEVQPHHSDSGHHDPTFSLPAG